MSKDKSNINQDELQREFSDVDLALDISPDLYKDDDNGKSRAGKLTEDFQREFRAVFEEEPEDIPEDNTDKKKFFVMNPDGAVTGVFDWIRCVLFAVAIVVVCLTFVFRLVEVDGKSMMDTLENQDKVIVTNLFYTPHNNDIVVIAHATNYNKPIIKRVIATEGQTVKLDYDHNKIYVDGVELNEPYIKGTTFSGNGRQEDLYMPHDDDGNFVIPEGKMFVMGDNREVSLDSRSATIGMIDVHDVIGKAQFVVFPFGHFGYVYDK